MNKIIKSVGIIFSLSIPLGCVYSLVTANQNNHQIDSAIENTKTSFSTTASIYEFGPNNWNAPDVATAFSDRFASTIQSSATDQATLESKITVPSGFNGYKPVITIIGNDSDPAAQSGHLYVKYDYSSFATQLPQAAQNYLVQNFTYSGFNYLPDYEWSIDASSIDRNQLASNVKTSDVKLIESPKMKTYAHTTTITGVDDGDGTLTIEVEYPTLAKMVPNHKKLTITDFYHGSDFTIASWGTLNATQLAVAPTAVTQDDVLSWINVPGKKGSTKPIQLNNGLKGVTPTIDLSANSKQNNMVGDLDVWLTFTSPLIINGHVTYHHRYQGFFGVSSYSITVDKSNLNINQLASDAKPNDFSNAIVPSPALLKHGGPISEISIHTVEDTKGTLTVNCHYPKLNSIIPILDYSYIVTGYQTPSSFNVANWWDSSNTKFPFAPTEVNDNDILKLIANNTIVLSSNLVGITPTVAITAPDNINGTLDVTLTFTDMSIPSGSISFSHEYKNLYAKADYTSTVDNSKVDTNKSASDAVKSDFVKYVKPSPALLKYGGNISANDITISNINDAKGSLDITYSFSNLPSSIITIPPFTQTITGYNNGAFVFNNNKDISNPHKLMPTEILNDVNNGTNSFDFINISKTDSRYVQYIFSTKYPNGAKAVASNANDNNGSLTISYDFSNVPGFPSSLIAKQSCQYSNLPTSKEVVDTTPPKKNESANYDISGSDINPKNAMNYISIDKATETRMKADGYSTDYEVTLNKNGSVSITVVYIRDKGKTSQQEVKCAPVILDGFKSSSSSWIEQYWWSIIIIVLLVIIAMIAITYLVKLTKRMKLINEYSKNKPSKE